MAHSCTLKFLFGKGWSNIIFTLKIVVHLRITREKFRLHLVIILWVPGWGPPAKITCSWWPLGVGMLRQLAASAATLFQEEEGGEDRWVCVCTELAAKMQIAGRWKWGSILANLECENRCLRDLGRIGSKKKTCGSHRELSNKPKIEIFKSHQQKL